jgi:hypothetical protein
LLQGSFDIFLFFELLDFKLAIHSLHCPSIKSKPPDLQA